MASMMAVDKAIGLKGIAGVSLMGLSYQTRQLQIV